MLSRGVLSERSTFNLTNDHPCAGYTWMASSVIGSFRRYHVHEVRVKDAKPPRADLHRHYLRTHCVVRQVCQARLS